eukprot:SAG25_NODE_1214_length_3592_cov_13.138277_4_plen_219_part_00
MPGASGLCSHYERARYAKRQEEMLEIARSNHRLYRRLKDVKPVMDRQRWDRHAAEHELIVRRRSKLPFVLHGEEHFHMGHDLRTLEIEDDGTGYYDGGDGEGGAYVSGGHAAARDRGGGGGRGGQILIARDHGGARSAMEMVELSRSGTGISAVDDEREWLERQRYGRAGGAQSVPVPAPAPAPAPADEQEWQQQEEQEQDEDGVVATFEQMVEGDER